MIKKRLVFGAIPTLNMPKKSHEIEPISSRRPLPDRPLQVTPSSNSCYKSLEELSNRARGLKCLADWVSKFSVAKAVFKKMVEPYMLPHLEVIVDDSLAFSVKVYGCCLVDDHPLYLKYRRSMQNVTLSKLIKELEGLKLCTGIQACEITGKMFHHVVPLNISDSDSEDDEQQQQEQFPNKGFWRYKGCLLLQEEDICVLCDESTSNSCKAKKKCVKPAQLNAPVSKTDPERIKLTLKQHRLRCAQLEQELHEMRTELQKSSMEIDNELSKDLITRQYSTMNSPK